MVTIREFAIENFRGIRLPLKLNFIKNGKPTSAIVYGRNGTGKSSIVDAWEWLLTCKIDSLRKEGVSEKDFPHKSCDGENSYVSVSFQKNEIGFARSRFNKNRITTPIQDGSYSEFKALCNHSNHLRYSDLQSFVFKTKTDKYKYIAKYFGLESFTKAQDGIQFAINKVTSLLDNHKSDFTKQISQIKSIASLTEINDSNVLSFINIIADKHSISKIDDPIELGKVLKGLERIIEKDPITKELLIWKTFKTRVYNLYPISVSESECAELKSNFDSLIADAESIKLLILSSLYDDALQVIPKLDDPNKCPVCNKVFEGDLYSHVEAQHKVLQLLNSKKRDFENLRSSIDRKLKVLEQKIHQFNADQNEIIREAFGEFFDNVATAGKALPSIIESYKGDLKDLKSVDICAQVGFEAIVKITSIESLIKNRVEAKVAAFESDEGNKSLATDFRDLSDLFKTYKEFKILEEKIAFLQRTQLHLTNLFQELTVYIQNKIQNTFDSIAHEVVDYFDILEGAAPHLKNPQLKLLQGKDKAIELEIEFANIKTIPAFKILSESQINSFGLAIFLACVKHFNSSFKFFILDDIVNSFDAFKRPRVARLFASKFKDFQILILTHDQVFFDLIQRDFPEWQRYKFTAWDYTTGPKIMLSRSYTEEIVKQLDDDNPVIAGSILGRYLEWILGMLSQKMETPISYKVENIYTLSEFYSPLVKRFKDKLKKPKKNHKLIQCFDDFNSNTIFRNYCAHYKNESAPFTASEIDEILRKWLEIEELLFCSECKSFISYESINNDFYIKCSCGELDLMSEVNYN